jgi:3'-5' exonuclease
LQQSLSKEVRTSEWGADILTEEQIHYAALDAWVALQIWDVLKSCKTAGAPLTSATPVGQPISLFVKKQEVAQGFIVKQPAQFTIEPGNENTAPTTINVSTTRTRAVVKIDKVLAPKCIIAYHKKALGDIQNGQNSFEVVVSIAALRTRSLQEAKAVAEPPRQPGTAQLINPPDMSNETVHMDISTEFDESENILDDASEPDIDGQAEDTDNFPEYSGYTQNALLERIAGILADVFHEIEKITRTISKKHTLCRKFARAFSDTMLVPDEGDKIAVEAVLAKKVIKWEQVRSKSPTWLWKRVCRYIPEKDILHHLLSELFQSWGTAQCSITNQPLFSAESWKKAQRVLHDVKCGWISDPTNIPLYTLESQDKNGLPIYHCIRGTKFC